MGEETKYCGNCKREVSATNFTVHTVHCQRNIALCPLCKEPVPRSTFQHHLQTEHEEVRCQKCDAEMEPARVFVHEKEECPKRLLACQHCELEVQASELQRHVEYCEARTERCKGCTKYVQVKHLQFHYESDHRYLRPEDKVGVNSSDDEASDECPICLGPFTLPLALECGHTFCMVCVKGIANTTKNCAICRRDIPRDMLMDVRFCREEEIIKNYVNKPRNKKNTRSHSVPNRSSYSATPTRRLVHHTTQDYDDMVNALLSSRTSSTSYRYQRPSNTHTPPSYTPYSSTTTSTTTSSSSSSSSSCQESCQESCSDKKETANDDDCCCSSSSSSSPSTPSSSSSPSSTSSTTTTTTTPSKRAHTTSSTTSHTRPSTAATTTTTTTARATTTTTTTTTRTATVPATPRTTTASSSSSSSSSTPSSTSSSSSTPSSTSSSTSSSPSSLSNGARPRRPTSLALETMSTVGSLSAATSPSSRGEDSTRTRPPRNATQEQYDRWLAFQLAKAEDDLPAAEFNRKHKPAFKRSQSMPDRPDTSSSSESESDTENSPRRSTRRPPASPRTLPSSSSSSSASSSSSTTPISKSSSESNATTSSSSSSVLSTGARPKNTRLKKRVSFREETTPVRREAPVLLPCEFCDEMFSERDLMRHQTSCDKNETQLPRTSRLTPLSTPPTSPSSSASFIPSTSSTFSPSSSSSLISAALASASSTAAASSSSATTTSSTSSSSSTATSSSSSSSASAGTVRPRTAAPRPSAAASARRSSAGTEASSRASPAPAPARTPASSQRRSPTLSPPPHAGTPPPATITIVDRPPPSVVVSAASARPFSESPAPSASTSSASVCTSPSTSSSASPVPAPTSAPADTPTTDLEMEEMEEETPYMRPRRGRLLSSAIFSWRSISATGAASRRGYMRSNTAPLEDTGVDEDEETPAPPVLTSLSATQLPPTSPEPQSTPPPARRQAPTPPPTRPTPASPSTTRRPAPSSPPARPPPPASPPQSQERPEAVFVKNPNKYRAPPPPQPPQPPAQTPQPPNTPQPQHTPANTQTPPPQPKATTTTTKAQTQQLKTSSTSTSSTSSTTATSSASSSSTRKSTAPPPPKKQGEAKGSTQQLNGFRFDSQPMMVGGIEDGIPCEFCSKVLPSSKFQSHQTMCEAATQPPTLRPTSPAPAERPARPPPPVEKPETSKAKSPIPARHKKGPAPPPPSEEQPKDAPKPAKGEEGHKARRSSPIRNRMERSHSVMDERVCYSEKVRINRHLHRTNSIKESSSRTSLYKDSSSSSSRASYCSPSPSLARRWSSREVLYGNSMDSPSSFASSSCWGGSSSSLYGAGLSSTGVSSGLSSGYTSGHGWASPLSFLRDDVRGRLSSSSSCAAAASSASSYYGGGVRYRERSVSRARPTSLYTTSDAWGSLMDLHSPTRQFNIADTFSSASLAYVKRYLR